MPAKYNFIDFGHHVTKVSNGPDDTPLIEAHDARPGYVYEGLSKEAYVAMQRVAVNALSELVSLAEADGAKRKKRAGDDPTIGG